MLFYIGWVSVSNLNKGVTIHGYIVISEFLRDQFHNHVTDNTSL